MKRETRDDADLTMRAIQAGPESRHQERAIARAVMALLADVVPEEEREALSTEELAQRGFSKLPPHQRDSVVRNYGTLEPTPAAGPLLRWHEPYRTRAHDERGIEHASLEFEDGQGWLAVGNLGSLKIPRGQTDSARRAWAERVLTAAIGARWER